MKLSNIVLNRDEVEQIQQEAADRGIAIDTPEGQKLLKELVDEYRHSIWADRDYAYGQDEGEPQTTADYNR